MSRASVVVLLGAAGCMRIYPDPELPDVEVAWSSTDCVTDTGDVVVALRGVDDETESYEQTVACGTFKTSFKDVSRQRFRVDGQLLDAMGGLYSEAETGVDLRNGFDQSVGLYFGGFDNFRIAWAFNPGESCMSLGVDFISVELSSGNTIFTGAGADCEALFATGYAPAGTYMARVTGFGSGGGVRAISPEIPATLVSDMRTDLGTVLLTHP